MKRIIFLLAVLFCCQPISIAVAAPSAAGSGTQPTPLGIACNAKTILPTDVFTITVQNACKDVTYSLYKNDDGTPLASGKGTGGDLTFTGAWGDGDFKVLDGTGQEMKNKVSVHLYWPLFYNFTTAEMDINYPFPVDGCVSKLDLYACWGPTLEGMTELFERYNAGDSPTWDNNSMRIYAEGMETIDKQDHTVFHVKIFVAPNVVMEKIENKLGIHTYEGIGCNTIYQYPLGELLDWDMRYEKNDLRGHCIHLTNTQYLVDYALYNHGKLVTSQLQEPYKEICFDHLEPGIYTVMASRKGVTKTHPEIIKVELDKFAQQEPLITNDIDMPAIPISKEGDVIALVCDRDSLIDRSTILKLINEFNAENESVQMNLTYFYDSSFWLQISFKPNYSNRERLIDSKFIFHGDTHLQFQQKGNADIRIFSISYRRKPNNITVKRSQPEVTYEVCENGVPTGLSLPGTGDPIVFKNVPDGIYTVRGTRLHPTVGEGPVSVDMDGVAILLDPEGIISPYTNAITTKTYFDALNSNADITYYDGLGAPRQTIHNLAAPDGRNLIEPILYDKMYRDNATVPLPYPSDTYTGERVWNAEEEQRSYYARRTGAERDNTPYASNIFDRSGQNRIRYSYRPGDIYRRYIAFTEYRYETNKAKDRVYDLKYNDSDGSISVGGYVADGRYPCNTVIDEDGNKIQRFTDTDGNTVLERRWIDNTRYADTYYVYDPYFSRLVWVISPEGSTRLQPDRQLKWDDEIANLYCYRYKYDGRGNKIERQLPGCEKEEFVYDKSGRLIFFRNGNLRAKKQWMFQAYDNEDNLLRQSFLEYDMTQKELLHYYYYADNLLETVTSTSDLALPSSFDSWPEMLHRMTSCIYSDIDYTRAYTGFEGKVWTVPEKMTYQDIGFNTTPVEHPKGLKTYEKLYILGDDSSEPRYLSRAYYYDYKNRVIQIVEERPDFSISRISYEYDLQGNILRCQESHQPFAGADEDVLLTSYTYDHRRRVVREQYTLNDSPTVAIDYKYDELGQLVAKTTRNGHLLTTMNYNLQGWLKDSETTDNGSKLFETQYRYYDPQQSQTRPCFTGNISEWSWRQGENTNTNTFAFSYDGLSRLLDADQYVNNALDIRFTEKGMSYDDNGNILTLDRYENVTEKEALRYRYRGNQLLAIDTNPASQRRMMQIGKPTYPADSLLIFIPKDPIDPPLNPDPTNPGNPGIIFPPIDPNNPFDPKDPSPDDPGTLGPSVPLDPTNPDPNRPGNPFDQNDSPDPNNPIVPGDTGQTDPPGNTDGNGDDPTPDQPVGPVKDGPEYAYDAVGNMVYDPLSGLNFNYNPLNLLENVMRGDTVVAKYSYLADGTKFSATDADDNGLYYFGSLVYRRQNGGDLTLESAAFNGGRFVATASGIEPHYFVTDHLGSVRVIVDSEGTVLERNNYYPFGKRWNEPETILSDNRYRYNGKEEQAFAGVPYTDYGARMYDGNIARFFNLDRFSERNHHLSPYHYTANNPIKNIDINGDSVRVYIETLSNHGLGHTWISTGEEKNLTIYTYGRYAGTNGSKTKPASIDNGPGVLVKLVGDDAKAYNKAKSDYQSESYTITDLSDTDVDNYFQNKLDNSSEIPSEGDYANSESARVIDDYNLIDNNCTTIVSDALNELGSKALHKPVSSNVIIGNRIIPVPTTQTVGIRFNVPSSMRSYLQKK